MGGHGKDAGRARVGIVEGEFPKGAKRVAVVGSLSLLFYPKTLCSVILLKQNKVPGHWYSL